MGGRDRRVVHVHRLQRYDEVVQDDTNLASQPRPDGNNLASQPMPDGVDLISRPRPDGNHLASQPWPYGNVLTDQQSPTAVATETSAVMGRLQRKRLKP